MRPLNNHDAYFVRVISIYRLEDEEAYRVAVQSALTLALSLGLIEYNVTPAGWAATLVCEDPSQLQARAAKLGWLGNGMGGTVWYNGARSLEDVRK